jgi:hypothetical protein
MKGNIKNADDLDRAIAELELKAAAQKKIFRKHLKRFQKILNRSILLSQDFALYFHESINRILLMF